MIISPPPCPFPLPPPLHHICTPSQVTPGLLFNLTEGKPYVIGSRQKQMNHWVPSTRFLVGKQYYFANFMVQVGQGRKC